jgi:hypothetical protein
VKASPIQWALCVTCLLLLFAKVWDWWQSLGQRGVLPWGDDGAFPQGGTLQVGLPLSVVAPDIANAPPVAPPLREMIAPAPVAPAPAPIVPEPVPAPAPPAAPIAAPVPAAVPPAVEAPAPVVLASAPVGEVTLAPVNTAPSAPHPAPVPAPVPAAELEPLPAPTPLPAPAPLPAPTPLPVLAPATDLAPAFDDCAPDLPPPEAEHSQALAHLSELAVRELSAARLRAKSMLINAEEQARAILEEAARMAATVASQAAALPRPQGPDPIAARHQGQREGHAIGLRKGEIEALARIEHVFAQIESLLDMAPVSRTTSSGELPEG